MATIDFTQDELKSINEALDMAINSNKRMQTSKPKFAAVFQQIDAELQSIKYKLNTPQKTK